MHTNSHLNQSHEMLAQTNYSSIKDILKAGRSNLSPPKLSNLQQIIDLRASKRNKNKDYHKLKFLIESLNQQIDLKSKNSPNESMSSPKQKMMKI